MKKAFTLLEIMIAVTIIGLLVAMVIPVCQKVKATNIAKQVYRGQVVTNEEKEYMLDHINMVPPQYLIHFAKSSAAMKLAPKTIEVENLQTIVINGKTYKLVPQ